MPPAKKKVDDGEEPVKTEKKTTKKTSSSTAKRITNADVVKSNQEIKDALAAINARLDALNSSGASADPVELQQIMEAVKGIAPAGPALTPEQNESLKQAASGADRVIAAMAEQKKENTPPQPVAGTPADPAYLTSREQFDLYNQLINRRDGEFADKQLMTLLEQLCELREDFRRLCTGMEQNISGMKPESVLSSFKCYQVDIENMLRDAGVRFGSFGNPGQPADSNTQRLVGIVETDDPAKDGTVAKKLSSGYEYKGRAIYKEKVMVYKTKTNN